MTVPTTIRIRSRCPRVRARVPGMEPRLPAAQLREQPENLQVEPDQRHQQAEGAVPLEHLRRAVIDAFLDEREVEDQVQRREADDEQAEQDPDRAALVDEGDVPT